MMERKWNQYLKEGQMPDGKWLSFDSEEDYKIAYSAFEDDFYDFMFEVMNGFELEYPEDYVLKGA